MLVSKKSPFIGGVAAQPLAGGQPTAKAPELGEHFVGARLPRDGEYIFSGPKLDVIAFFETEFPNETSGKAYGQGITPFRNLQDGLPRHSTRTLSRYTLEFVYGALLDGKHRLRRRRRFDERNGAGRLRRRRCVCACAHTHYARNLFRKHMCPV